MAGRTGLEPATSDVTGRRSNQLNYHPALGRRENHPQRVTFLSRSQNKFGRIEEWAVQGSNLRHPACKAGALPAELTARILSGPCP